jgi:tetratricopeptide (TPR) repeat protein
MAISGDKVRISAGEPLSKAQRYLDRALDFYSKGEYLDALNDLDDAIRAERRNPELYATRGLVLLELDNTEEAEKDFERALKIDPTQWAVHFARGKRAFDNAEFDEALKHFSEAQRVAPMRPEIYVYRAAIFYHQRNKTRAEAEIDAAMQTLEGKDKRSKDVRKWRKAIMDMSG